MSLQKGSRADQDKAKTRRIDDNLATMAERVSDESGETQQA
jgi:hypothetical protein